MPDVTIPDKPAFKASEVCELAQIQPYVLRSWESEFSDLGLSKTPGGPRVYRRIDVERVLRIRELVFTEGLTLSGVRRRFEAEQPPAEEDLFALVAEVEAAQAAEARARVESAAPRAVRKTAAPVEEHLLAPVTEPVSESSPVPPPVVAAPAPQPPPVSAEAHARLVQLKQDMRALLTMLGDSPAPPAPRRQRARG